jgi:3-dehydroquinate synthase
MVASFVNSERVGEQAPKALGRRAQKIFVGKWFSFSKPQKVIPSCVISSEVRTAGGACSVLIGWELLGSVGEQIKERLSPAPCAVISDTNVAPHFADPVLKSLNTAGFEPRLITIEAGEQSKTLEEVGVICRKMLLAGLDRQSFVIGLGGGMIGDLSGFVAAIFERGIPHLQIPTTLLAMVDSSIGGKTGVNTFAGKNLLGAVHQPSMVIDDIYVLKTLPRRVLRQGFAEIIKHAVIADAKMFQELRNETASDVLALQTLIQRNVEIKSGILAKDEFDRTGERALLNFGHTIGHAIERAGNYEQFLHGEAVSIGIIAACAISVKKAGLSTAEVRAIVDLLERFGLPTRLPEDFPHQRILDALRFDKKFERGEIRFVVTPKIGSAKLSRDVTMDDIREVVPKL